MPVNVQKRFDYLGRKVEAGKASKFEERVYNGCERALEFCKSYLKKQNISKTDDISLEVTTDGPVRMLLFDAAFKEDHSFLAKLKDAGYKRDKESIIPPIEPYLLLDIKSPRVTVVNNLFEKMTPRIVNQFEDKEWGGFWHPSPQAKIIFKGKTKEGILTFCHDKFSDLNVTVGRSFSMEDSQKPKSFIEEIKEFEKEYYRFRRII